METVAETTNAQHRRRENTRQRLLEAALSVFARHGYERATVDQIVHEAGFSKGAFYVHFERKEDLFWTMFEERMVRQQQAFREAATPGAPVRDTLRAVLRAVFDLERQEPAWPAMFAEFLAHASRNHKVRERLAAMIQSWRDLTAQTLAAERLAGRLRQDMDIEFVSMALVAVVEGILTQARLSPDEVRLEEIVDPLARLLAQWLEPQG